MPANGNGNTPKTRSTRSGSSSATLTIADVKVLTDSVRVEVIDTLKSEIGSLKEVISSLQGSINALEKKNQALQQRCSDVDAELQLLRADKFETASTIVGEVEDRLRRGCNLVISGVPEPDFDDPPVSDFSKCAKIIETVCDDLTSEGVIKTANRIGRPGARGPRLLKIKCKDVETRNQILRRAKDLRKSSQYKGVFINPDRTRMEQMHFKSLLKDLKYRKDNNEDVVIFRDSVVRRKDVKNF